MSVFGAEVMSEAELTEFRGLAESRMTSRVTIRRSTGRIVQDEISGLESPEWAVVYTDLPFRLGGASAGQGQSRTVNIGGVEVQLDLRTGHMPASSADLRDADLIDITDGENAGGVYRIVEAAWQDQATARRVPIVAAERPVEW